MAHRTFTDENGLEWLAFDVTPRADDRRGANRRWSQELSGVETTESEDRRGPDRRVAVDGQRPPRLTKGWVCFEREGERRRLQPVPEGWSRLSDVELREFLAVARVAPLHKASDGIAPTKRR